MDDLLDTAGAVDSFLAQPAPAQAARASMSLAVGSDPDAEAKFKKLSLQSGVPVDSVRAFPTDVANQVKLNSMDFDQMAKDYPSTTQYLAHPDTAAIAHDDVFTLKNIEQGLRDFVSGDRARAAITAAQQTYIGASAKAGALDLLGVGAKLVEPFSPFTSDADGAALFKDDTAALKRFQEGNANFLSRFARAMSAGSQEAMANLSPEAAKDYQPLVYATTDPSKAAYLSPVKVIGDTVRSLPTMLAMGLSIYLTKGTYKTAEAEALAAGATPEVAHQVAVLAAAKMMSNTSAVSEGTVGYAQQYNQTMHELSTVSDKVMENAPRYKELIAQGYAPEAAKLAAITTTAQEAGEYAGIVDAAVNKVGGYYLGKILTEGGSVAARVTKGGLNEGLTEFAQSGGEQFGQNAATKRYIDPTQSLLKDVLESMVQGGVVGFVSGGTFSSISGASKAVDAANKADVDSSRIKQLFDLAANSKLKERDAGSLSEFVQSVADSDAGIPSNLYIDANTLLESLQQAKITSEEFTAMVPSVGPQLEQALATGGTLELPIGELTANVAGTGLEEVLLQHLRTSPDALSQVEAKAASEQATQDLSKLADEAIAKSTEADALRTSAEAVKTNVLAQLTKANRFTQDVNDAYSSLVRDFYTVTSQRLNITPEALYQQYPLKVASATAVPQASLLTQPDRAVTETPEFKSWFGDSKVVDAQGKPLVVYHSSTFGDFSTFDKAAQRKGMAGYGFYFSDSDGANIYADYGANFQADRDWQGNEKKLNILPVYLTMENPLVAGNIATVLARFGRADPGGFGQGRTYAGMSESAKTAIQRAGYDGVMANEYVKRQRNGSYKVVEPGTKGAIKHPVYVTFEPNQIKSAIGNNGAFDPNDPNILHQAAPTSDIGHKREKASGRYVGAPDWVGGSPQKLAALRTKLRSLAQDGEAGRFWYERSSRAILDMVGGNKVEAERIVALIAIYSPNTTVEANMTKALSAYYQWKAGQPIKAGMSDHDAKATKLLVDGEMWSGVKTNAFYQNLMVEIDPSKLEPGRATMDMWMALAFDYGSTKLDQGPMYTFAELETQRLANELGWTEHQAQAAVWTGAKARVEAIRGDLKKAEIKKGIGEIIDTDGKPTFWIKPGRYADHYHLAHKMAMAYELQPEDIASAKKDFADAIGARQVQLSWEATPGPTTGVLPGIFEAPLEQKTEYLQAVDKALHDENGVDLIAQAANLPTGTTLFGYGAWKGQIGAGAQTFIPVPSEGVKASRAVKPVARELLNLYSAIRGYVMTQEAVVWHTPVFDDSLVRHNGVDIAGARALTSDEMMTLYKALEVKFKTWDLAPGYTDRGARVLNFVEGLDNAAFRKGLNEVLESLPDDFAGGPLTATSYRSDGDYISNDWQENPNGEGYLQQITSGRPDLLGRVTELRARVAAVNEKFAAKYGWDGQAKAGVLYQSAGTAQTAEGNGGLPGRAIHFSGQGRTTLDGRYYGTGLKGLEGERVLNTEDKRLKERVYFYLDTGNGVRPEAGVGGVAHELALPKLYDAQANPEGLWKGSTPEALNATETALLDHGYGGYFVKDIGNGQGAGVVIGQQSRGIKATQVDNPTTGYQPPSLPQPYKRALLASELKNIDIAAIQTVAPSAVLRAGTFQVDEAEFGAAHDAAAAQGVNLPSPDGFDQSARGTFSPSQLQINVLENANLTTFLHETGHFFLHVMADLASRPNAPEHIKQDMATALKWFGVKDLATWNAMTLDEQRPHHEQFARGFEAYLFEGKSPNIELQGLFQRFRDWLVSVYKSLGNLNVTLTDEVRGVFDRMLATEQQVAEAEQSRAYLPLFKNQADAKMTDAEWQAYQQQGAQGTADATQALQAKSLKNMQWLTNARGRALKELQAAAKEKRNGVEAEVRAEVQQMPVYAAQRWMKGKGLPDGSPAVGAKMSMQALKEAYGEGPAAPWRYLATNLVSTEPALSMAPGDIASVFGFTSGDAMVKEIISADSEAAMVEGLADQRMLERYGDLATPEAQARAADEAVHNEARTKFVATELQALRKATNVKAKSTAGGTINVLLKAAQEYAANIISRKQIKEVKPAVHAAAEARAAREAEKALAKGDLVAAATAKRNQLLSNVTAKEAYAALVEVEKTKAFFRKVMTGKDDVVGKTRDLDVVNTARAIIAQYGIGIARGKTALEYLSLVQKNDPMLYDVLAGPVQEAITHAKPFVRMTVEEMRGLRDEIEAMWHLAKRTREMVVGGQLIDRQEAADALVERLGEIGIPDHMPGDTSAVTPGEKRLAMLQTAKAAMLRVESWAGAKDGNAPIGPFRKYVWQVVKEAANAYRADKAVYLKKYRALLDGMEPAFKKGLIEAPELGYTFGKGNGGIGMAELLHAVLHTGNESNKRKLLAGRRWGTIDAEGNLDTSKWDAFVKRMQDEGKITKQSYDFAQGVWDMLEETKPMAQRAHRDVFGKYFAEVSANSFDTPYGMYRGGYVPAIADPAIVQDAAIRALAEAENESMAFAFPGTNKGFTKARVEYNRPLKLDLRSIGQHLDKVLLFSHMEQPVRDVRKLLSAKGVSYALGRVDPPAIGALLTPWLNRAARQQVETPIAGDGGTAHYFTVMRNNAGMAAMFANVANTVQQLAGFSLAAVKVQPKYLLGGMAEWIKSPVETTKTISEASPYMANRMENEVHTMQGAINDILLDEGLYGKTQAWMQKHTYFMQSAVDNVMGPMIWIGARNQALEQGLSDADAVRLADSAVRETQGSSLPEDVSRIETGNAFVRVFTQFMGFFNMNANLLGSEFAKIQQNGGLRKGAGRALFVVTFGFLVQAWAAEAIMQAFKGGPDDEDKDGEYLDDWLWQVFGMSLVRQAAAMVPVAGPMVMGVVNATNSKPYDDRLATSPAISMIEALVRTPMTVYNAIVNDGKKQKAVKDVATTISMATGIPVSGLARPVGYLAGVATNEITPTSNADLARGIVTGTASPESKR